MTNIYSLPDEILDKIATSSYHDLLFVSHHLHTISLRHHYRTIKVQHFRIFLLARSVALNTALHSLIRNLSAFFEELPPGTEDDTLITVPMHYELPGARRILSESIAHIDCALSLELIQGHSLWVPSASVTFLLHMLPNLLHLDIVAQSTNASFYRTAQMCTQSSSQRNTPLPESLSSIQTLRISLHDWDCGAIMSCLLPLFSLPSLTSITINPINASTWRHTSNTRTLLTNARGSSRTLRTMIFERSVVTTDLLAAVLQIPAPGVLTRLTYELGGMHWDGNGFVNALIPLRSSLTILTVTIASRMRWQRGSFGALPSLREMTALQNLIIESNFLLGHPARNANRDVIDVLPPTLKVLGIASSGSWQSGELEKRLQPAIEHLSSLNKLRFGGMNNEGGNASHTGVFSGNFINACSAHGVEVEYSIVSAE